MGLVFFEIEPLRTNTKRVERDGTTVPRQVHPVLRSLVLVQLHDVQEHRYCVEGRLDGHSVVTVRPRQPQGFHGLRPEETKQRDGIVDGDDLIIASVHHQHRALDAIRNFVVFEQVCAFDDLRPHRTQNSSEPALEST
jgi:hypothetical protein